MSSVYELSNRNKHSANNIIFDNSINGVSANDTQVVITKK